MEGLILPFTPILLAASFYAECGLDSNLGVDKMLHERAAANRRPSYGLETAAEQVSLFTSVPVDKIITGVSKILTEPNLVISQRDKLLESYVTGDAAGLFSARALLNQLNPDMGTLLLSARETRWLPRVLNLISSGVPTTITVGALHLAGEDGLLGRLVAEGVDTIRVDCRSA